MTDEHLDDALKDLRAELNVTPSPEFAAKVRERIEQAPAKPSWNVWAWAGAAATCVVAVIAVVLWRSGQHDTSGREPVTLAEAQPVATAQPPVAARPAPVEPLVTPSARAAAPLVAHATAPVGPAAARRTEPEVLVPPDQLNAIRRLMAAVRAGEAAGLPQAPTLIDPDTGELIPPKLIEIPLIVVDPLPGTPDGRSGGRENR
jgi:hypothetical protein